MTTSIYRTWVDRIESGRLSPSLCLQWAKAVVPISMGLPPSGKHTNLTELEAIALIAMIPENGLSLYESHAQIGIEWLRKYGTSEIGIPAELIDNFDHFTFHGGAMIPDMTRWRPAAYPIWRMHTTNGDVIEYFCGPWQINYGSTDHKVRGMWRRVHPENTFLPMAEGWQNKELVGA